MKDDGKNTKKKPEQEDKEKKKKKKKSSLSYGGLPESMDDAKQVTTETDSGVARSMGGTAVAPGMHQMGGLPGLQPGMAPPSHYGAKMQMTADMMAPRSRAAVSTAAPRTDHYGWKFADVPTLPEFHPLERTAVFAPHSDAPAVARRVSDVLRERSITAVYDDKKAKAKCETEDGVEFRVRLYRGRNKFSHGVIVEVQRRFGFSPSFAGDMYAILDAAEGKPPAAQTLPLIPPPSQLIPVVSDDDDDGDDFDASPSSGGKRKAGAASLRIASDMLKRAKTADANVLALESLASLTDPAKMGPSTALRVSRQILTGSGDGGEEVRDAIVDLLKDEALDSNENTADLWDEDKEGVAGLRLHAMAILSNAVSVLASSPASSALLKTQSGFLAEDVLPELVSSLREAESNPRMAVLAARCLKSLVTCKAVSADMKREALECDAEPALAKALEVGERGNNHLAEESAACIKALS
eukprot:CAMPEP_0197439904 /NCGR_PEP_ID=MMETSP1175-20131217/6540_1 /TAXON_ID=1003142 /ORGANISM="Triceratium dubium, Strain CCMP147" /LENGTH=468 /DNA_ID=CAMNT_0042969907 /DNA_START=178 /DNA_END=1584 /DNA_ORIENTATION=+